MDESIAIRVDGQITTYGEWCARAWPDKDCRRDIEWNMGYVGAAYRPEGNERCSSLFTVMERVT